MKTLKLIVLFFVVISTCSKTSNSAYIFVDGIYSNYGSDENNFTYNGHGADTLFALNLLRLIRLDQQQAQGEVGYLDADPICACQDSRGLKVDNIRIKSRSDTTFAKISFRLVSENKFIMLKLENKSGKWLISDIIDTTTSPSSLVHFLSEKLEN